MANALSFTGSGDASVSSYLWVISTNGDVGAVEFYVKTTSNNEVFFSAPYRLGQTLVLARRGLIVWMDSAGLINIRDSSTVLPSKTTTANYVGNVAVNDGEWHLISLYSDGAAYHLYVDGTSVALQSSSTEQWPMEALSSLASTGSQSGSIHFGVDAYTLEPVAPAYSGLMSELRLWQGGSPDLVLTPAFSLNVGVPLPTDAANLALYWPFWTSQPDQLVDMVSQTALVLNGPEIVPNVGQYYNDISEVICNATMAPFDSFTENTTAAAFSYVVQEAALSGYTPTTLRQAYLQQSYSNSFSIWYTNITRATYPSSGQTSFTQADFDYVQNRLLEELEGVATVWGFYQTAYDNLTFVAEQYTNAASTVFSTLLSGEASGEASIDQSTQSDLGSIVDAVSSVAALIPEGGEIIAGVMKGAWSVIGFSQEWDPLESTCRHASLSIL